MPLEAGEHLADFVGLAEIGHGVGIGKGAFRRVGR